MSITLWSGRSLLDPSTNISVYLTGRGKPSKNIKTGAMLQTWILRDDMPPNEARRTGADSAICGNCPHRAGSCYVNLAWAPSRVYNYRTLSTQRAERLAALGENHAVRLGAYGDPAAVPFDVWTELLSLSLGWTGYTHQWRTCDPRLKKYCMASVDSLLERDEAHDLGWRTFRVGGPNDIPAEREVLCPASEFAGKKMRCIDCLHCSGNSNNRFGDAFIPVHGSAAVLRAHRAWSVAVVPAG